MATREENLKKINAELEQLSDEELEDVAGGNAEEIRDLYLALDDNPKLKHYMKNSRLGGVHSQEVSKALKEAFGIDFQYRSFITNIYETKDGKFLNHKQVLEMIKNYR